MKKIWCDLCGKELGTNVSLIGIPFYSGEPSYLNFTGEHQTADICRECENILTKTMHKAVEERKKLKKVKE